MHATTGRSRWRVATYVPEPGSWTAQVRAVRIAGRSYERWHVAIIDQHGAARHMFRELDRRGRREPGDGRNHPPLTLVVVLAPYRQQYGASGLVA